MTYSEVLHIRVHMWKLLHKAFLEMICSCCQGWKNTELNILTKQWPYLTSRLVQQGWGAKLLTSPLETKLPSQQGMILTSPEVEVNIVTPLNRTLNSAQQGAGEWLKQCWDTTSLQSLFCLHMTIHSTSEGCLKWGNPQFLGRQKITVMI